MSTQIGAQLPLFGPPSTNQGDGRSDSIRSDQANISFCVLGSGSGGNSTVVRFDDRALLIDAGFGPTTIAGRLKEAKLRLADIRAICLTHLDQDHFRPTWIATLLKARIPVFLHRWHVDQLRRLPEGPRLVRAGIVRVFEDEPFEPVIGFTVKPIRLAHDVKGTCGFKLETVGGNIGYATDLGHVPDGLIDHFTGTDLLAIESNYDPQMQRRSGRPLFLQRRIMGKQGHLSNQQAFDAVCAILDRACSPQVRTKSPQHIVLLHRSRQCNCPTIVRDLFGRDKRIASRLTMAEQRRCTPWLRIEC